MLIKDIPRFRKPKPVNENDLNIFTCFFLLKPIDHLVAGEKNWVASPNHCLIEPVQSGADPLQV